MACPPTCVLSTVHHNSVWTVNLTAGAPSACPLQPCTHLPSSLRSSSAPSESMPATDSGVEAATSALPSSLLTHWRTCRAMVSDRRHTLVRQAGKITRREASLCRHVKVLPAICSWPASLPAACLLSMLNDCAPTPSPCLPQVPACAAASASDQAAPLRGESLLPQPPPPPVAA